jgi:predicted kinase
MFLDSFENLDAESRGQLLDLAREHDVQLFAGQVADTPLEVEKA